MFNTLSEVKQANREAGQHWFDFESMNFFGSKVYPTLYGGKYFVSSEYTGFEKVTRAFSVREAHEDGSIGTVGEFLGYNTFEAAEAAAKELGEQS
jgi:hypothetical protein